MNDSHLPECLPQEDVADERLEDLVGRIEVSADDGAGDDDDDCPLDDLVLGGPLDLLELGDGPGNEPPKAAAWESARAGLPLPCLRSRAALPLAPARAAA